jgi:predicted RNA-binding Zn-ribbon protein involved in translation (DUF1610 family)
MQELKVPLALDSDNQIVGPESAIKNNKYSCPGCGDTLILRKGEIKRPHFSHKASDTCSQETIIHKLAKSLIAQTINAWKEIKGNSPEIKRKCPDCEMFTIQTLPDKVESAVLEKKLDNGYVVDVAILSGDKILAAVEVRVFHAVDEHKKSNIGLPFIEVLGEEIINNPLAWNPILDKFNSFKCRECEKAIKAFNDKVTALSRELRIPIPTEFYRTAYSQCWKCGEWIPLFIWPNDSMHSAEVPRDIPRPKTIKYRYSKMAGTKYWANTCPHCDSIQGDFFLYSEPDSPLFGFRCGDNTEGDYKNDMKSLAIRYLHYEAGQQINPNS